MTTKLIIKNDDASNGDAHIRAQQYSYAQRTGASADIANPFFLKPGEEMELGITDSTVVHVFETWPTTKK